MSGRLQPSVSVVIPVYNADLFLREALDCVAAQTLQDIEIIVVDDGSTDKSIEIVIDYQKIDPRVHLYRQQHLGVSIARKLGIEKSVGELIAFLDADDLWHPSKLRKQRDILVDPRNAKIGLVYSFSRMIDVSGNLHGYTGAQVCKRGDLFHYLLIDNFIGNGSAAMVRRSCLPKPHPFDPAQAGNTDIFFYLQIAAKHDIEVVPEFLIGYRWNTGQNSSANIERQIDSRNQMMRKINNLFPGIPLRVLSWSDASFYLSYAQTFFKKKKYNAGMKLLLSHVLIVPSFVFSPPFRRLVLLALKAFIRRVGLVQRQSIHFLEVDPKI